MPFKQALHPSHWSPHLRRSKSAARFGGPDSKCPAAPLPLKILQTTYQSASRNLRCLIVCSLQSTPRLVLLYDKTRSRPGRGKKDELERGMGVGEGGASTGTWFDRDRRRSCMPGTCRSQVKVAGSAAQNPSMLLWTPGRCGSCCSNAVKACRSPACSTS